MEEYQWSKDWNKEFFYLMIYITSILKNIEFFSKITNKNQEDLW